MIDVIAVLNEILPGARFGGSLNEGYIRRRHGGDPAAAYAAIRWEDARPKPPWSEIETAWPAVQAKLAAQEVIEALARTDAGLARVIEDLLVALEAKGVLSESELPAGAQAKLSARRALRAQLEGGGQ